MLYSVSVISETLLIQLKSCKLRSWGLLTRLLRLLILMLISMVVQLTKTLEMLSS
jgi:competence protein ComGF